MFSLWTRVLLNTLLYIHLEMSPPPCNFLLCLDQPYRVKQSLRGWLCKFKKRAPQTAEVTTHQSRWIRVEGPCDTAHQGSLNSKQDWESFDVDKQTAHKYPWTKIIYGQGEAVLNCRDNSCETPAPLRAFLMKSCATQVGVRSECGQVWPVWTMWE